MNGAFLIDGGQIILDVGSRPGQRNSGTIENFRNPADFGEGLVMNFTGELADGTATVDIGDSWDILPRDYSGTIQGIANVGIQVNGAPVPAGWLPANSHLEISRYPNGGNPRGLRVRIAPDNGFVDYTAWAVSQGLDPVGFPSDPDRAASNGIPNLTNFLYGNNGGSGDVNFVTGTENGVTHRYASFSFTRPLGTDANYLPYFSLDLEKWEPAAMVLSPGNPPVTNGELELVTLKSIYPTVDEKVFLRIQAEVNPDNFGAGRIPEKPITHTESLRNYTPPGGTQPVTAGSVLYFNVNGSTDNSGSLFFGGTAPDGITRNSIYMDRSRLDLAVVHAGLLRRGQRGIIRVTFVDPQQTAFIGSTQNILSDTGSTIGTITSRDDEPEGEAYSYKVELYRKF